MLILRGILRAATILGGGTSKKTGEVIPERPVLQIETTDSRGLVAMQNHHRSNGRGLPGQDRPAREPSCSRLGIWPAGEFRL